MKKYRITKKIAKSGENNIIVIPRCLKTVLTPRTLVKLDIEILDLGGEK